MEKEFGLLFEQAGVLITMINKCKIWFKFAHWFAEEYFVYSHYIFQWIDAYILSRLKTAWPFTWTALDLVYQKMCCFQCSWIWLSCPREDKEMFPLEKSSLAQRCLMPSLFDLKEWLINWMIGYCFKAYRQYLSHFTTGYKRMNYKCIFAH